MGWKYGGKRGQIDPESARWLNFWTLIGVAFIFILCLIAANDSDIEANPILGVLSLLGIISLLITPFLFFISLMAGGTCTYGFPKDLWEPLRKNLNSKKEQQKAVDFFNRYNKESEENQKTVERQANTFKLKTDGFFNKNFKGFNYDVGDKKYRFNVKNTNEVKETQSDINNFVKKFLNKNNEMEDAAGYHKSLFTAMNADAVAKHFYEQGKADALKESIAKSKNVDMNPRQAFGGVEAGGIKVRVLGDNSNDFKFKIKNRK